jgi:hypothetical protein
MKAALLPMSALGQKQTFSRVRAMSALPPRADIPERRYGIRLFESRHTQSATRRGESLTGETGHQEAMLAYSERRGVEDGT